jgi:hypothetical protein
VKNTLLSCITLREEGNKNIGEMPGVSKGKNKNEAQPKGIPKQQRTENKVALKSKRESKTQ